MEILPHFRLYFLLCNRNRFLYCRSGAMLHSGDLVKIELILVIEQETPPLYLWKAPNRLIERFIPFFLNHAFIKALRHTQRPSVKGFVPYLVKLPVPLVPLEKIPVPALHLPKLHKELFRHFQLVGFALPVLKADKIPCAAFRGFLPKRVCLNSVYHPVVLLPKMSEGISIPHPVAHRTAGCFRRYKIFVASSADGLTSHRWHQSSNAQAGQSPLWNTPAFSAGRFSRYARPP